jgi:hypothetical protein
MDTWNITRHATPDYAPQFGIYAGSETRDFATVYGDDAERRANLCAAAPDLLAALRNLLDDALAIGIDESPYSGVIFEARDAIAKAEGNT